MAKQLTIHKGKLKTIKFEERDGIEPEKSISLVVPGYCPAPNRCVSRDVNKVEIPLMIITNMWEHAQTRNYLRHRIS